MREKAIINPIEAIHGSLSKGFVFPMNSPKQGKHHIFYWCLPESVSDMFLKQEAQWMGAQQLEQR